MTDTAKRFHPARIDFANFRPKHFLWQVDGKVATVTLNRPERKNPLTLECYAELRDTFRDLAYSDDIKVIVITGAGGNFCSGGDVHEIIGPLVEMQQGFALGGGTGQSPGSQAPPPQPGNEPTHLPPTHSTFGHAVDPSGHT